MKIHPAAEIFPRMTPTEFDELVASIKANGQQNEIVVTGGQILDGRHRFDACKQLGVVPKIVEWKGQCGDPITYVLTQNLQRRNLTASQKAACAAEAIEMFEAAAKKRMSDGGKARGGRSATPSSPRKARDDAAAAFGASPRSVQDAKKLKQSAPELFDEVRAGRKTVSRALAEHEQARSDALLGAALDKDPQQKAKLETLSYSLTVAKLAQKTRALLPLDPEDVATGIDDETAETLERVLDALSSWAQRYTTARRRRSLTSIKGGKK